MYYYRFLHCSYKEKSLIFCVTGNENNIISIVQENADTMVLAAYLLQRLSTQCNIFSYPHKVKYIIIKTNKIIISLYHIND